MLRKLLKAFHRLFGLHGRRVALQKRSMIMYTHERGLGHGTPKAADKNQHPSNVNRRGEGKARGEKGERRKEG